MRNFPTPLRLAFGVIAQAIVLPVHGPAADPIEEVGKTTAAWVNTRAETVRITSAWTEERELLLGTLNGLKDRADRLQQKRDQVLAATADERTEQADLTAKLAAARENVRATDSRLAALSAQVLQLRPLLPPRLSEALEMSYRSLGGKDGEAGERMQWIMTILNRCAQFNQSVTMDEEVLALAGEPGPKAVDVIYWGLSHGYALDRAAHKAWLGSPGAAAWQWEPIDESAPAVAELMAISRDGKTPRLVVVPARVKGPAAQ